VAAVTRRFAVEGEIPAGPVLLVDDLVVSGWTMTLGARALREAGATEVLPLALGVSG
jgi:ATP-dependent DNA helicase RecQ